MPSYAYAITGALPADNLEAAIDAFPGYREMVAALWPELGQSTVRLCKPGETPDTSREIPITIVDQVTDEDALAFHTRSIFGAVSCVVERQQCLKYRVPLGPALFHELIESGINPQLNRTVTAPLAPPAGGPAVMTSLPLEIADPVTSGIVTVNGIAQFTNITSQRFWLLVDYGPFDLLGQAEGPLPTIPRGGAIEDASGNLRYGDEVTPELRAYLKERRGRRWAMRQGVGR